MLMSQSGGAPRRLLHLAAALLLIGCGDASPTSIRTRPDAADELVALVLSAGTVRLFPGDSLRLQASFRTRGGAVVAAGSQNPVTWSTSNPGVATVDQSGLVRAVAAGGVAVKVAGRGLEASADVAVHSLELRLANDMGDSISGTVGRPLDDSVSIHVTDAMGEAVPGAEVTFEALDGGSVADAVLSSDAGGRARTVWTLGRQAGRQRLVVTLTLPQGAGAHGSAAAAGTSASLTLEASAEPAPPAAILDVPASFSMTPGEAVTVTPVVRDEFDNTLEDPSLTWSSSAQGVATVDGTGTIRAVSAGSATVTVRSGSASASSSVQVSGGGSGGGSPSLTLAGGNGQSGPTGSTLATPLRVVARDASGNPMAGLSVSWAVTAGGGSVSPSTTTTDGSGTASTSWTLGSVTGAQQARAAASGIGSVTFDATATSSSGGGGAPTLAASSGTGQSGTVGQALASPVVVIARDGSGAPVSGATVTWSVLSGGGSVSSSSTTTNGSGQAQVTWTLGTTPGVQQVRATQSGVGSVTFDATASAGAAASLSVSPASASLTAGGTRQLAATVRDGYGNTLSGASVAWSSSNTSVATVSAGGLVTAQSVGSATITAGSGSASGTAAIAVAAPPSGGSPTLSASSGDGQSGTVGQALASPVVVIARDGSGAPASGITVTWAVLSGGGSVSSSSTTTNGSGQAQVTWTLGTSPGAQQVRATRSGVGSVTFDATASAGAAASVSVSPGSASLTTGGTRQLAATVRDGYGNTLSGAPVAWSSSATSAATVSSSGLVTAQGAGNATITATSGSASGTASITVSAPSTPGAVEDVTDLTVTGQGDTWLDLRFTQADDGTGAPADYQVRWAVGSISWGSASVATSGSCASPLLGTAVGATMTCRVSGLTAGTAYEVQLVPFRGTLSSGTAVFASLSNVASGTTTSPACSTGTVTISPNGGSVQVGNTLSLSATARDCSGTTVPSPGVSWSSSSTSVATVNGSGTVTGQGAGTAWVRAAASCCTTDSVQVTVTAPAPPPPPSGSTAWPNLPSGMSTVVDDPMTTHPSSDWGYAKRDADWNLQTVSTPSGEGRAVAVHYPSGFRDGADPGVYYTSVNGATRLYYGYTLMLENPYDMPGNGAGSGGGQKFGMFPFENGGGTNLFALLKENGSGQHELWANFNGGGGTGGDGFLEANATSNPVKFQPGTWYRIEWYVQLGRGNGIVRAWVSTWNGSSWGSPQKQLEYTNLDFGSVTSFGEAQLDFTWGGGAGNKTQNDYIYIDASLVARN